MSEFLSGLLAQLRLPDWLRSRGSRAARIIRASGLFDAAWYLEAYPDVAVREVDPLEHYIRYGAREGRDPNRLFSSSWYLASNPDVTESGLNPPRRGITMSCSSAIRATSFGRRSAPRSRPTYSQWSMAHGGIH
jgi:hypothetical protein